MTGDRSFYTRVTVVALLFIAGVSVIPVIVQGVEGAEGFYFGFIPVVVSLVFAGLVWRYGGRWLQGGSHPGGGDLAHLLHCSCILTKNLQIIWSHR